MLLRLEYYHWLVGAIKRQQSLTNKGETITERNQISLGGRRIIVYRDGKDDG